MRSLRHKLCKWWLGNKDKLERIHSKLRLAYTVATAIKSFASADFPETLEICLIATIAVKEGLDNLCGKKLS